MRQWVIVFSIRCSPLNMFGLWGRLNYQPVDRELKYYNEFYCHGYLCLVYSSAIDFTGHMS